MANITNFVPEYYVQERISVHSSYRNEITKINNKTKLMMRNFRLIWGFALCAIATLGTSCVDNEFRIDEVSGEITIASGDTSLPLGYLPDQRLGDIINASSISNLVVYENGDYALAIEGTPQEFNIDGMQTSFTIPQTTTQVTIAYPDFSITEHSASINKDFNVGAMFGGTAMPNIAIPVPAGHEISGVKEGELTYDLSFDVPTQVANIRKIFLKPDNDNVPGASIRVDFNLNSLAVVNGGGKVSVRLEAPKGYELYGEDLKLLSGNTYEVNNRTFAAGQQSVAFCTYIRSVENTAAIQDGKLQLPSVLKYHISYTMTTTAGTVTLSDAPSLQIQSNLHYDDAEIELRGFDLGQIGSPVGKTINVRNIPEEVKSVKEVAFTDATVFCAYIDGLDWLPKSVSDNLIVEMTMPEYFELESVKPGLYNPATRTLKASLSDLHKSQTNRGIELRLHSISFDGNGLVPKDEEIDVDFTIAMKVGIKEGTIVKVSEILHRNDIKINAGIAETALHLASIAGHIDYSYVENMTIGLGDLANLGLDVSKLDVSPILRFTLNNEFTIPVTASAHFTPMKGSNAQTDKVIALDNVHINAGVMENGAPKSVATNIVIAKAERRAELEKDGVVFIESDLSKIFEGELPDKVNVNLTVKTDPTQLYTFHAAPRFTESYSYSVEVPFEFGGNLDMSYSDEVTGLNDTMQDLAAENLRVGDLTIIAEIGNSSPLELILNAEFIDVNGNRTKDIQLEIDPSASKIAGSPDGKSVKMSTVKIALKRSGNSTSLTPLKSVDGIRFSLRAKSAASGTVALNAEQTISARLTLNVKGGVGIDVNNVIGIE